MNTNWCGNLFIVGIRVRYMDWGYSLYSKAMTSWFFFCSAPPLFYKELLIEQLEAFDHVGSASKGLESTRR